MARWRGWATIGLLNRKRRRGDDPNDPNSATRSTCALAGPGPDEPAWDSPWGAGRPGWHIECLRTMSTRSWAAGIDIHGGGRDLNLPHHPSEIAQTECYSGKRPFVRFWIVGGMAFLGGEEVGESLGNMVFCQALKDHSASALRCAYIYKYPCRDDFHYERGGVRVVRTWSRRSRLRCTRPAAPQAARSTPAPRTRACSPRSTTTCTRRWRSAKSRCSPAIS